jgi:hypothetical protein
MAGPFGRSTPLWRVSCADLFRLACGCWLFERLVRYALDFGFAWELWVVDVAIRLLRKLRHEVPTDGFAYSFMVSVGCIGFLCYSALRMIAFPRKMYG